ATPPDDELEHLACNFNDMATRIDDQLGALRELAAIDHDILRGAPLSEVVQRLLAQVLRAAPRAVVAISWRDCASLEDPSGEPGVRTLRASASGHLASAQLTGLPSLAELGQHTGDASDDLAGPWLPDLPGAGWCHVLRAVEREGQVEGLIALALPPASTPPDRLDAVRDRLAVALTARRRDRELAWRATHDSLTSLLNRLGLHDGLDRHLATHPAGAEPASLALMHIDLDHFKDVNDTRGHDVGDRLLCQVAERLVEQVPPTASVARLGGDEFVVLLPGATADAAFALASHICRQLKLAFLIDGISTVIGASAGISMSPDHGQTRVELARRADIALYTAKAHRGSVCLFSESLDQAASERAAWVAELREAIVRQEFMLHY
ncbi:MAG: GGDEF domain-containing protein, partial [Rubrivivax sp.]|nr:GGDEF domain-containing protein [Rubrivivax sp.]